MDLTKWLNPLFLSFGQYKIEKKQGISPPHETAGLLLIPAPRALSRAPYLLQLGLQIHFHLLHDRPEGWAWEGIASVNRCEISGRFLRKSL